MTREKFTQFTAPFGQARAGKTLALDHSLEWLHGRYAIQEKGGVTAWFGVSTAMQPVRLDAGITSEQNKALQLNDNILVRLRQLFPDGHPMETQLLDSFKREQGGFEKWLKKIGVPFGAGCPLADAAAWITKSYESGIVTTSAPCHLEDWQLEKLAGLQMAPEELTRIVALHDGLWLEFAFRDRLFQAIEITDTDLLIQNMGCDESPQDASRLQTAQREIGRSDPHAWLASASCLTPDQVASTW